MGTVPMFAAETTLPWKKSFAAAKMGLPLRPGKSYNPMRLVSETSGKVLIGRLTVADTFWSRFVGLQFQRKLAAGDGLLLVPCSSVHTSFLRFPLDVVFLDRHGSVLAIRRNLRPWRMAWGPRKSHAVLEVPAGSGDFQLGEQLRIEPASPHFSS